MPAPPVTDQTAAPPALSAFLRGVERRAAVFAHLQAGDDAAGMEALAEAMGAFRTVATRTAFGDWPRRFWAMLLATPQLREPKADGRWPEQFQALAQVGRGPRAALLLRLVAHVSEADAAAALGVSRPTYRMALRRALPRDAEGRGDDAAWQALGAAAQQAVRDISPQRMEMLAQLRDAALQGVQWSPPPPPGAAVEEDSPRPRWLWPALAGVVLATVAGVLAAPWLAGDRSGAGGGPDRILSEALAPGSAPEGGLEGDLALLTHPDFELLAAEPQDAAMHEPAFHAWLVHQIEGLPQEDVVREQREETPADVEDAGDEGRDDVP
ncbi:MAG TPA: sigma-70 region 4 domain-containing protein [Candidatus Luteimonas excrementigallinarum]|nr:sigma-70 region 4 domain-containing protein [Candidatus Luteimonas excrementigallinarum]